MHQREGETAQGKSTGHASQRDDVTALLGTLVDVSRMETILLMRVQRGRWTVVAATEREGVPGVCAGPPTTTTFSAMLSRIVARTRVRRA